MMMSQPTALAYILNRLPVASILLTLFLISLITFGVTAVGASYWAELAEMRMPAG